MRHFKSRRQSRRATQDGNETMIEKAFDGVIENAYGRKLADNKFKEGFSPVSSLTYSASFEELQSFAEIPADEMPDQKDILSMVNNARKANARSKAIQKTLDDNGVIKPTLEDDDELKIASIVRGLVASKKYDEAGARAMAKQMLGIA